MRVSKYLFSSLKKAKININSSSYEIMLNAGIIKKLASGLYNWLPTGIRVLSKLKKLIKKEMDSLGALEIQMPVMQPENLWEKSGRLSKYGPELLKLSDRKKSNFILGPTHEEVAMNIARNEISSYKQLPVNFYQIQTKFRDELRPRSGLIRAREFLMKDSYSFHNTLTCLQQTYEHIKLIYKKIFDQLGLDFGITEAESGNIGGKVSHEFYTFLKKGENKDFFHNTKKTASKNLNYESVEIAHIFQLGTTYT